MFTDEIATYTSITAGIHSHYFLLYDKIHQLEPGSSEAIIWEIPSLKFVFDSSKVARPSSDPLIEPAKVLVVLFLGLTPHGYNFFIKLYPYGISSATGKCASILFTLFPGDYDNLLQWPFLKLIHFGIRDQLDPLKKFGLIKTRPTEKLQSQQKQEFRQTSSIILSLTKLFSKTEGFLIDGAILQRFSDTPVLKLHTQTSLLFPIP